MRIRGFFAFWAWVDMVAFSLSFGLVFPTRTLISAGAHRSVANALTVTRGGAWRVAEPTAELSCKIIVVAKAAGIGNLAERLACLHQ
jgi:hypothetical protein